VRRFGVAPPFDGEHTRCPGVRWRGRRYISTCAIAACASICRSKMLRSFAETYGQTSPPPGEHDEAFHSD
jgi:hypothetical protein